MKTVAKSIIIFIPVVILLLASCDQPKKTNSSVNNIDTQSVKKMSTDSNSNMPVAKPKDSTEKIPNPYDPAKK